MLQLRYDRLQRAALMMRLAEVAQADMRFTRELVFKRGSEPRFADAWLPGKQHHTAFAVLDLRPAPLQ